MCVPILVAQQWEFQSLASVTGDAGEEMPFIDTHSPLKFIGDVGSTLRLSSVSSLQLLLNPSGCVLAAMQMDRL